jgi:oxygen-independent coproporphyrinogen III oxidase
MKQLSLYIHIPFCTSKCTYCAFNTYIHLEHLIEPFVNALTNEIITIASDNPYPEVSTVYFGGGTPSLLEQTHFEHLLTTIHDHFCVIPDAEISTETNPNDLSTAYLQGLHEAGVNRLSIGMQSSNFSELKLFARRHDHPTVVRAVEMARAAGFDNINLDLMYGFPHQTLASWAETLDAVCDLQPEHISLYALGLEDGTPLYNWVQSGQLPQPDDDLAADMYEMATTRLAEAGYQQYEISNWCLPGYACQHNLQYWYNRPYLGLGPGAHGFAGGVRYATELSPQRYIKALSAVVDNMTFPHTPAVVDSVRVAFGDEVAETLIMNLRLTDTGVSRTDFRNRFGVDLLAIHGELLRRFEHMGLLTITPTSVCLTANGRLLSNVIFRELV